MDEEENWGIISPEPTGNLLSRLFVRFQRYFPEYRRLEGELEERKRDYAFTSEVIRDLEGSRKLLSEYVVRVADLNYLVQIGNSERDYLEKLLEKKSAEFSEVIQEASRYEKRVSDLEGLTSHLKFDLRNLKRGLSRMRREYVGNLAEHLCSNSSSVVIVTNHRDQIVSATRKVEKLIGGNTSSLIGENVYDFLINPLATQARLQLGEGKEKNVSLPSTKIKGSGLKEIDLVVNRIWLSSDDLYVGTVVRQESRPERKLRLASTKNQNSKIMGQLKELLGMARIISTQRGGDGSSES